MLDTVRRHSQSFVIYLMFAALILVFAVNFGPGSGSCGGVSTNYAAQVDGESIPPEQFVTLYQRQVDYFRRNAQRSGVAFDSEMIERMGLRDQVIDSLIEQKLLAREAERRGLKVSGEELLKYVQEVYGVEDLTGDEYERLVRQRMRTNPHQFEADIRETILQEKMRQLVTESVAVSDGALQDQFLQERDRAKATYVRFDSFNQEVSQPTEAEAEKLLEEDEEKVRQRFDKESFKYRHPKQVRVRQIVKVLTKDASEADVAKVRGALLEIKDQIVAGADFAAVAAKESEDEATKDSGGDLGLFKRGDKDPAFDIVFGLNKNDFAPDLVRTDMGLHLVQVTEVVEAKPKEFDDVKLEVAKSVLLDQRKQKSAQASAQKFLAALKGGKSLQEITQSEDEAKEAGDKASKPVRRQTPWVQRSSTFVSGIGKSEEVHKALFSLTPEEPLADQVFEVGKSYYVVKLDERETPDLAKFEEEKDELRKQALQQKRGQVFRAWVKNLRENANVVKNPLYFPSEQSA